jgi:hypothetical protein
MKTIFTLLLSTLFSIASFAIDGTRLTISSITSNKMYVEVDGRKYNLDGNTVIVRDIRPGYHNVKVFRELKKKNNNGWGFGNRNRTKEETLYNTRVYLKDGYHFDILVNRFGKVLVDERRIDVNDDWYTDDDDDYYEDDRNNDRDRDLDNNRNDRNNDDRYDNRNDRNDDRYDNNNRNSQYDEMSDANFSQAKETLRKEWFENTRVSTAKQLIDRNYFTSRQVKDLMLLFTFENNRLDFAKYAYSKVVDKGNYFIVNDALSMSNSKEELNRFIREQR